MPLSGSPPRGSTHGSGSDRPSASAPSGIGGIGVGGPGLARVLLPRLALPLLLAVAAPPLFGCQGQAPRVGLPPEMPAQRSRDEVGEARIETVASGLETVWGLDFAPDGRIFLTERPGRIRVIEPETGLRSEPWAEIDVWARGESGLMGLALHPAFPDSPFVFVMYTHRTARGPRGRVSRFHDVDGRGTDERVILDGIPAAVVHSGGALQLGPDGALYVGTGDATEPRRAQDRGSLAGKILRITPNGNPHPDNPDPGSPVYALGLRNVQGFDWDPSTGRMLATMHGPTGEWGHQGRDEVNVIRAGGNYGWPEVLGAPEDPRFEPPLLEYRPAVAPAGAAFYNGPIQAWRGDYFFATLRGEHVHRVVLTDGGASVESLERLWPGRFGRVRAIAVGPDGHLYFGTSNRDGRGRPRAGDDHLYRVIPAR